MYYLFKAGLTGRLMASVFLTLAFWLTLSGVQFLTFAFGLSPLDFRLLFKLYVLEVLTISRIDRIGLPLRLF